MIPHGYETVLDNLIHLTLGCAGHRHRPHPAVTPSPRKRPLSPRRLPLLTSAR